MLTGNGRLGSRGLLQDRDCPVTHVSRSGRALAHLRSLADFRSCSRSCVNGVAVLFLLGRSSTVDSLSRDILGQRSRIYQIEDLKGNLSMAFRDFSVSKGGGRKSAGMTPVAPTSICEIGTASWRERWRTQADRRILYVTMVHCLTEDLASVSSYPCVWYC